MIKYFTVLFVLFAGLLQAQDVIVKMDSSRVNAKVLTVTDRVITYKRTNSPDGPVYEISRRNVARIVYGDGTIEVYGKTSSEELTANDPNIISVTTTDLVAGVVTLNYERIIGNEVGVRITGSMGILGTSGKTPDYSSGNFYYNRFKVFSVGTDVHYYVYRGNRLSWYTGALIEYGMVKQHDYYWDFPPYGGGVRTREYYMGGITNGLSIRTNSPITLDMFLTLGWKRESTGMYNDPAARFGFSMGYRF